MLDSALPERLATAQQRLAKLTAAETRLRKLNFALGSIAMAEKPKQLKLIKSAHAYLEKIADDPVPGLKKILASISNELQSLEDGIRSGDAKKEELVLLTGASSLTQVKAMKAKTEVLIAQLEAGSEHHMAQNEKLIEENRAFKEKLPNLNETKREFAIAKMPLAFTFQNKQGHSSVGYVSPEALDLVGFKVQNIAGYTIIHNQLVIGVSHKALVTPVFDSEGNLSLDDKGEPVTEPVKIKEMVTKFKGNKPIKVPVRRAKTLKDVALAVIKDLNRKTNQKYELVSDKPVGAQGAGWFWIMSSADIKRLSKAMPGNHVGIAKWGFAS